MLSAVSVSCCIFCRKCLCYMKSMRRGASFLLVRSNLTRFIHNDNDAKRRHCVSFAVSPLNENEKRELTGENNLDIAKKNNVSKWCLWQGDSGFHRQRSQIFQIKLIRKRTQNIKHQNGSISHFITKWCSIPYAYFFSVLFSSPIQIYYDKNRGRHCGSLPESLGIDSTQFSRRRFRLSTFELTN